MTKFSGGAERRRDQREHGFTLIELLIVIVVLGILATIVVLAVGNVTSKSAKSACAADLKNVQTAVAAYNAQNSPPIAYESNDQSSTTPTFANKYEGAQAALLVGGTSGGTGQLQSWPYSSGHYFIGLAQNSTQGNPGDVLVYLPNAANTSASLSPNGCASVS